MREKRKLFSSLWDLPYGNTTPYNLFDVTKNSKEFVQKLQLQKKIPVHDGCVNSICWNDTGEYLLSGSDDQRLAIVHGYDYSVRASISTGHRANIFSAKFLPNTDDKNVVSCSGDGIIIYSHIERPDTSLCNKFACHKGTAYEIMTIPDDPNTFLSCGEDKTVRWFDVRTKTSCVKEDCQDDTLIQCQSPVTSLAINPYTPFQLAVGCADASVRMFDRRMLCTRIASGFCGSNGFEALMCCFTVPEFTQSRRITSLSYSADGQEMLVSYSSDYIYLFDVKDDLNKKPKQLSCNGSVAEGEQDLGLYFRGRPLMKRLRIRGDWSDTGPNARPEAEARVEAEDPNASRSTIVRTMTDILTRMFHSNQAREPAATVSTTQAHIPGEGDLEPHEEEGAPTSFPAQRLPVVEDSEMDEEDDAVTDSTKNRLWWSNPEDRPSSSRSDPLSQPGTSGTASAPRDKQDANESKKVRDGIVKYLKTRGRAKANRDRELNEASSADCIEREMESRRKDLINNLDNSGFAALCRNRAKANRERELNEGSSVDSIEREIESRRRELIDKHHSEPMVNLHYSGQSVSSGQITMDVATSSTANERQWLEQQQSISHLPNLHAVLAEEEELPSEPPPRQFPERAGPSFTSEQGVHDEQMRDSALPPYIQQDPSSQPPRDDIELMMELDPYDNEDRMRSHPLRERSAMFMESLNDEVKAANDELKKVEAHMSIVNQPRVKRRYTGHRNCRTMIKESTFWGDNFIMSGSDCGRIFIWDRHTTELVMLMEADHHVVNCLQPHPFDPILASSGIDYDIKLWAPSREEPFFDDEKAIEIMKRNEIMLEETKDTITVPASFMFRMFTTLNSFRTGRAYRWSRAAREMRAANERSDTSER